MKIVFDASSLISISQTCLAKCLANLGEKINAEFIASPAVYREIVSTPLGIKRFELNAVRLKMLVEKKHIQVIELDSKAKEFLAKISFLANNSFFVRGKPVKIMHSGELEALALMKQLEAETLAIDERTTRMLIENPSALHASMEARQQANAEENKENISEFQKLFAECNILRSSELVALAFETNAIEGELEKNKQALEAALYAVKFSGCSVSIEEIQDYLKNAKI
jgi:predicted nucleic acid-binding protein